MGMIPSRSPNRVTIRNLTKTWQKQQQHRQILPNHPGLDDSLLTTFARLGTNRQLRGSTLSHRNVHVFRHCLHLCFFRGTDLFFRPRDLAPSPFSFWSPAHRHFVMGLTRSLTDAGRKRSAEGREERFKQGKLPLKEPLAMR